MGLLDSVVGALGQAPQGGMPVTTGQGDLLGAVMGLLNQSGGLAGLVAKFHQGGLGDIVNSWISTGPNLPVAPGQLGSVLGQDAVAGLASKLGLDHNVLLGQLSQVLPQVVDKLTPQGQVPAGDANGGPGGHGGLADLAGMLGGLMKR